MKRRKHLGLMVACEYGGFFIGALVAIYLFVTNVAGGGARLWVWALVGFGCVLVGVMAPRLVFRRLIGCACDAEGCPGSAYAEGSRPIAYVCRTCGKRWETGVSDGGHGTWWEDRDNAG